MNVQAGDLPRTARAGWQEKETHAGCAVTVRERCLPVFAFCTSVVCVWDGCAVADETYAENLAQQHVINTGHTVRLVSTTETAYAPKEAP